MDFTLWEVPQGIQKKFNTVAVEAAEPTNMNETETKYVQTMSCGLKV